jgi:membrane-anchored protein YejM (alkaline phosphatase superfamily)
VPRAATKTRPPHPCPRVAVALVALRCRSSRSVCGSSRAFDIRHRSSGTAAGSNVLLITIDTLRADRVGAYGNRSGLTPTLDRLADSGIRFESAYTPVPMTLPAHASILTGLEPFAHGIRNNTASRLGKTPTLATMLKSAGYRTGAFVGALVRTPVSASIAASILTIA